MEERTYSHEKVQLIGCYHALCDGLVEKKEELLTSVLTEDCTITHHNGVQQSRAELLAALQSGVLKYELENTDYTSFEFQNENQADMEAQSRVKASLFEDEMQIRRFRIQLKAVKQDDAWRFQSIQIETY